MSLHKVTLTLDEKWFKFLSEALSPDLTEEGEVLRWESHEDLGFEPCEDCTKADMDEFACPDNEGYCLDCCHCEEHEGGGWRD